MKKLSEWLKDSHKSYKEGLELLSEHSKDANLKVKLMKSGETKDSMDRLIKELGIINEEFGIKADKAAKDKAKAEKAVADKLAADKAKADKIAADKIAADKIAADKIAADKAKAEKAKSKSKTSKK
jgi:hypothetical protein